MEKEIVEPIQMFEIVMQRLREAVGLPQVDRAAAELLGLTQSAYANRKRSGSLPMQEIVEVARTRNLSLDQIVLGRGGCADVPVAYEVRERGVSEVRERCASYEAAPSAQEPPSPVRLVQLFGRYSPGLERQAIVGGTNNLPCIEVPERWLAPGERYYANEVWTDAMAAAGIAKGDVVIVRATREPAHGAIVLLNVFKSGFWIREWWPQPDGSAIAKGRAVVASEQQETLFTAEERADVWPLGEAVLVIKRVGQ